MTSEAAPDIKIELSDLNYIYSHLILVDVREKKALRDQHFATRTLGKSCAILRPIMHAHYTHPFLTVFEFHALTTRNMIYKQHRNFSSNFVGNFTQILTSVAAYLLLILIKHDYQTAAFVFLSLQNADIHVNHWRKPSG